jgi:hypothetical protein
MPNHRSTDLPDLPHVNYDQLEIGTVYALRPEHLMSLEPAMYLGPAWHQLRDGLRMRSWAWAIPGKDGWRRPTWAWARRCAGTTTWRCRLPNGR